MKKAFTILLAMVLTLALSVSVCAAPGQFISSPSGNAAPTLISFERGSDDCTGELIITPFNERDTLPDDLRTLIEKAYSDIAGATDLSTLNKDLADLAAAQEIAGTNLKVSDLFDLRYEGCDDHDETHTFNIVLGADTLHRFVGLMYMNEAGEWVLVDNAKVINNGTQLSFTVSEVCPFAIVVDTSDASGDAPQTLDNSSIFVYGALMVVSALAVVVLVVKSKKYA